MFGCEHPTSTQNSVRAIAINGRLFRTQDFAVEAFFSFPWTLKQLSFRAITSSKDEDTNFRVRVELPGGASASFAITTITAGVVATFDSGIVNDIFPAGSFVNMSRDTSAASSGSIGSDGLVACGITP